MSDKQETPRHTPGPWVWRKVGDEWLLWGEHGPRPIVLDVGRTGTHKSRLRVRNAALDLMVAFDPNHSDARLIATAPELLAAAKAALVEFKEYRDSGLIVMDDHDETIAQLESAITKAEKE